VIGADSFGLGASRQVPNCFIVPRGTVQALLDHHRASLAVLESRGLKTPRFFVWGWSQGGWSTMQFLRRLETPGIPVTAAATVSAPVDLAGAYRWKIKTPVRAYAGAADEAIPPVVSRMAADFPRLLGSTQVEFVSVGERADHRAAYVSATLAVKPWFDGFVTPAAA
jgi:pimeloyl-ACP methyl ester carboxylesterase